MRAAGGTEPRETGSARLRFAVIADVHLTELPGTAQDAAFTWALDQLEKLAPDLVVIAGDLTAVGTAASAERFRELLDSRCLRSAVTLGNSDRRTASELQRTEETLGPRHAVRGDGWLVLLPDSSTGEIPVAERRKIEQCLDADASSSVVVVTHVPLSRLSSGDRQWIEGILGSGKVSLAVGAHRHVDLLEHVHGTPVYTVRGLDPDKAIGGPPAIDLFECTAGRWAHRQFTFPGGNPGGWTPDQMAGFRRHLGISCMNETLRGLTEASCRRIPVVEVRGGTALFSVPRNELEAAVDGWRSAGGRHLSLHMPNVRLKEGRLEGRDDWMRSLEAAVGIGVNSLTVHVPRASVADMAPESAVWELFAGFMADTLGPVVETGVTVGIENMHVNRGEPVDKRRGFGYVPGECLRWIGTLEGRIGLGTVGMHLDIGHARNNGSLASTWPLGSWYALVGTWTVGFHLHQVVQADAGMTNHAAFDSFYGPYISLSSFFWAWMSGQLRHAPMFLEIREPAHSWDAWDWFMKSLDAYASGNGNRGA